MAGMFSLLAITGLLNGLIGTIVIQRLHKQNATLVDRVSIGLMVCGAVALSGSALSDLYVYREWNHWPEATITVAVLMRLCLRLFPKYEDRQVHYRSRIPLQ